MDREAEALKVVNQHMAVSAGVGFVPLPLLDMVALTGVQLNMLRKLAEIYEVPFTRNLVKSILAALVGGIAPTKAALGATGSLVKAIPGIGTYIGWATMPALAGATSYAIGRVFIEHFERNGTFLTFRPLAAREQMDEYMSQAPAAVGESDEESVRDAPSHAEPEPEAAAEAKA
jgi:uncharacterized protein (DUF697 family)